MTKQTTAQLIAEMRAEMKALREQVATLTAEKKAAEPPKAEQPKEAPKNEMTGKYKDATPEKMRDLLKENWQSKKDQYNAAKRAKRAAMGLKKRGRKSTTEPAEESSSDEEEAPKNEIIEAPAPAPAPAPKAKKAKVAPTKAEAKAAAVAVPAEPPRLRAIFGESVTCPTDESTWVANHTKKWEALGEDAKKQYPTNARKALSNAGYNPPKTSDPLAITDYALSVPIDIWKVVIEATDDKHSVHQRNNFSKGLLGVFNAKIRKMIETKDPKTHQLCVWATIIQLMNNNAKRDTSNKHEEQGQSAAAADNTSEWGEWLAKSSAFITSAGADAKSQRDAMIVAVYSMIPPVRRNWFEMQVVTAEPPKGDKRNSILITDKEVVTYWGNFKNKASFKNELPLRIPIESQALVALIRKYAPTLKNNWFFPSSDRQNAKPMSRDAFGKHIGDLAEKIVGKRFTCNRMRASFITHWHTHNSKDGKANVSAMRVVMRQLHQANLGVHLSYAKLHAKWNKEVETIKGESEKPDA